MKDLIDYIKEECAGCAGAPAAPAGGFGPGNATPGNTIGMGNPDGTEVPTAKARVEKPKKRKRKRPVSESESINEFAMKFNKKGFLAELAMLMDKYKVKIVSDVEGTYLEDSNGDEILDLTDKFLTSDKLKRIATTQK